MALFLARDNEDSGAGEHQQANRVDVREPGPEAFAGVEVEEVDLEEGKAPPGVFVDTFRPKDQGCLAKLVP